MSLTKVSYSMIQGEALNVMDYGAKGDGTTDDTTAIQATITAAGDSGTVYFPKGSYSVSEIFFNEEYQKVYFAGGAVIRGNATTAKQAVVHIVRRQCTFYDMAVSGQYKSNYTAAIKWYADGSGSYPNFNKVINLKTEAALIGVLFGATSSPVDAPVSENSIIGYTTRGVERPLYCNQPNGFLFVTNSVLDCGKYDWDTYNPGVFSYTRANCVENEKTVLTLTSCEFVKAASQDGWGVVNKNLMHLVGCTAEIASPNFYIGDDSETHINGYHCHYWNNSTDSFFDCEAGANARIFADNVRYLKAAGAAGAANGLINTNATSIIVARFSNCYFTNQVASAIFGPSSENYVTTSDIQIVSSYLEDTANSYSNALSMSDDNAAKYYQFQDITKYDVVSGGGAATATITASGSTEFANALTLSSSDATAVTAATKLNIDGSIRINKRMPAVEITMRVVSATKFYGNFFALYYDDAGTFISSQNLGDSGDVGPFTDIAGAQAYVTITRSLVPPINAAQVSLRFGITDYAQVWQIGNIKVY
jgi:hypothetical protein